MNNDLISHSALKESIQRYMSSDWVMPCNEILKRIDNAPTVDERPQGKWVYHKAKGYFLPYIECSVCHTENMLDGVSPGKYKLINKFCYNCGATMRGNNNEKDTNTI